MKGWRGQEEAKDALGSDLSIRLSRREETPTPFPAKRGQRLVPVAAHTENLTTRISGFLVNHFRRHQAASGPQELAALLGAAFKLTLTQVPFTVIRGGI